MPKWIRIVLAVIAGVFSGGICIALIEMLGHSLVQGDAIFIVAAVGLGIAAFIGGLVSAWISKLHQMPWVISILLAGLSLVNVFSFKHPAWFVPVAFILLAIGVQAASNIYKSKLRKTE